MTPQPGAAPFALDFDSVEEGQPFSSRGRTVTEADLVAFAALTGDWHPQHTDAVWAASSEFGERIAHGMLVVSFALGLVDYEATRILAVRELSRVRFQAPVKIGDTIRVDGRVGLLLPLNSATGLADTDWRVLNQHDEVVAVFCLQLLWRRQHRPA
jgi:3-hydroxybutyryl-CoA dehydratase